MIIHKTSSARAMSNLSGAAAEAGPSISAGRASAMRRTSHQAL
jgi:hypothetical protein